MRILDIDWGYTRTFGYRGMAAGGILVVLGIMTAAKPLYRKLTYKGATEGTLICVEDRRDLPGESTIRLVYRYNVNGQWYEREELATKGDFVKGGSCRLRYQRRNPAKSIVASSLDTFAVALGSVFIVIGLIAAALGYAHAIPFSEL